MCSILGQFYHDYWGRCRDEIHVSTRVIWSYNLYTEEWRKHEIPGTSSAPEPFFGAIAAAIDKTIYTFGGNSATGNPLWNLSKTKEGCFTWSFNKPHCKKKSPSPRTGHTGWEYAGKLWIFAGHGVSPADYLNDHGDIEGSLFKRNNQLLCFDSNIEMWTNPQCFGSIPTPRSDHASAIIHDKVWIFGGIRNDYDILGDMFELRMSSFTWSQIQTAKAQPSARADCTLTDAADDKLVLHGGLPQAFTQIPQSDTWIMDLTFIFLEAVHIKKKSSPEVAQRIHRPEQQRYYYWWQQTFSRHV